jgi:WD40 repeat protein
VWDIASGMKVRFWDSKGYRGIPTRMAFSKKGGLFAVLCDARVDGNDTLIVRVMDFAKRKELAAFTPPRTGRAEDLTFSHDGRQLIIAGGGSLQFWDVEKKKEVTRIALKGGPESMAISPDGKTFAVHLYKGEVLIVRPGEKAEVVPTDVNVDTTCSRARACNSVMMGRNCTLHPVAGQSWPSTR